MTGQFLIEHSIRHNEIAMAPWSAELAETLTVECDGHVVDGNVDDYWGTDEDGHEWRVYLIREVILRPRF